MTSSLRSIGRLTAVSSSPSALRPSLAALACGVMLMTASLAHAELGGAPMAAPAGASTTLSSAASVFSAAAPKAPADPSRSPVARRQMASANGSFTQVETVLESGTTVREYISGNGLVFGVSWKGAFQPDFRELLGQHFDALMTEAKKTPYAGHAPLSVQRNDIVIQAGGHPRAFEGRAWIPGELPDGVKPDDIR